LAIRIVGPREVRGVSPGTPLIDTTSYAADHWSTGLSPFHMGPIALYGGHVARRFENAWQYAKVYPTHTGSDGSPSDAYWRWARAGWANTRAVRYPFGKGAKPAYCLWDGSRLGYIEARLSVYFPLYVTAVVKTEAFAKLETIYRDTGEVALFDFDGYDHERIGMSLSEVMHNDRQPLGHAFILKALLLYGRDVTPSMVIAKDAESPESDRSGSEPQDSLF
jgi:hypothetical protein